MADNERLVRLKRLFIKRQLSKNVDVDLAIQDLLNEIFDDLSVITYEDGKEIRIALFDLSDQFHDLFFGTLYLLMQKQLLRLRELPAYKVCRVLNSEGTSDAISEFFLILIHDYSPRMQGIRLTGESIPETAVSENLRQPLLAYIIRLAQLDRDYFDWARSDIESTIMALGIGRQIALLCNRLDIFYVVLGVVIERLNSTQEYQLARDIGEEILLTSYLDKRPEWGYQSLFMAFNGQSSFNMALIYANACMAILRSRGQVPDLLLQRFLFSVHRLYRNIHFYKEAEALYGVMINDLDLDASDRFNIMSSHFITQTLQENRSVINEVYEYITNNREFIFCSGKGVAVPLLNILWTIKLIFISDPGVTQLDDYVHMLNVIVGSEDAERVRAMTMGNSDQLKTLLVESLDKFQGTRSVEDFVNEVRRALAFADRLVNLSVNNQDIGAFFLAMILKADYSLVFPEESAGVENGLVNIQQQPRKPLKLVHEDYPEEIRRVFSAIGYTCLWLAESEKKVFSLILDQNKYSSIEELVHWSVEEMYDWQENGRSVLAFDESKVILGQLLPYSEADQLEDLDKIKQSVRFARVNLPPSENLLLVKAMELSGFPHNLITDQDGEFISRNTSITCLPSTEWYFQNQHKTALSMSFTTEIWIPIKAGDFTLNFLWSRLENSTRELGIKAVLEEVPASPLSGEVNIIAAHGAIDIAEFPAFFTRSGAAILDFDRVIGTGRILVLLVCHSGAMEEGVLRRKILSVARLFFQNNYQAVVAPFWSLHMSIPPLWVPRFIESLREGATVAQSVFRANLVVRESNKNPAAWACMHLYGNPQLRIT